MKRVGIESSSLWGQARVGITMLAVAWLVGCEGDEMPIEPIPATTLALVSGDGQSATRGALLEKPFVVMATDASGRPVAHVNVTWLVTRGFGILSHSSSETDHQGEASVRFTLGPDLGTHVVQAAHGDLEPVNFQAEAVAAPPAVAAAVAGDGQTARVSQPLATPLVVQVTGADGFVVPGTDVSWSVTAGGGVLSDTITRTDATGRASVSFSLGPEVGTNVVSAAVDGVAESATFTLEGTRPVTVVVEMKDSSFVGPNSTGLVTILLGDTVRWVNVETTEVVQFGGQIFNCVEPSQFGGADTVPLGTTVEWVYIGDCSSARIVSSSAPPGGKHFDSGTLSSRERFQFFFVPEVAGTWEYSDTHNGGTATLTIGPDEIDPVQHTATSNQVPESGTPFDSGSLDSAEQFEFAPNVRGTWTYGCQVHCPNGTGTCDARIVVN